MSLEGIHGLLELVPVMEDADNLVGRLPVHALLSLWRPLASGAMPGPCSTCSWVWGCGLGRHGPPSPFNEGSGRQFPVQADGELCRALPAVLRSAGLWEGPDSVPGAISVGGCHAGLQPGSKPLWFGAAVNSG